MYLREKGVVKVSLTIVHAHTGVCVHLCTRRPILRTHTTSSFLMQDMYVYSDEGPERDIGEGVILGPII